jgi:chromosome segregation ATPase
VQSAPTTSNSSTQPSSPLKAVNIPRLRISKSTETHSTTKYHTEGGDFIPYKHRSSTLRHTRSVSDSILLDSLFIKALDQQEDDNDPRRSLRTALNQYKQSRQRSQTTTDIPISPPVRPVSVMNVKTYLTYERLCQQKRALQHTLDEIKALANVYDTTATKLRQTYEKRAISFEAIQSDARQVMDEQHDTERRLKDVEDDSAKLHYELKVLNDKLKDIEDNVGTFYGKVGVLERKMDDSQQSITTMLIIGNYLNHYWIKVREWINWFGQNQQQKQQNQEQKQKQL